MADHFLHPATFPFIQLSGYTPFKNGSGRWVPGAKPEDTDFYKEMLHIGAGTYQPVIDTLRGIDDKDERTQFKASSLYAFTISGRFHTWRKKENLIEHTNLLNIDIDAGANPNVTDWGQLRDLISKQNFIVSAFLSASGAGLSFVVRVLPEEHHDCFLCIGYELEKNLIQIDRGVHDITRLRFTSYDPDIYINPDLEEIPYFRPTVDYLQNREKKHSIDVFPTGPRETEENFLRAVKRAEIDYRFLDGSKHYFLIIVAGWCLRYGIGEQFTLAMTQKHFGNRTTADVLLPVKNVYKTYKHLHPINA